MSERPETFSDYTNGFEELYDHIDRERDLEQIWLRLGESASAIGEQVREANEENQEYRKILHPIADVFCWLNNFINRCNNHENDVFSLDSEDRRGNKIKGTPDWIIWRKYPGWCVTCNSMGDVDAIDINGIDCWPCQCHSKNITTSKDTRLDNALTYAESHRKDRPESVDSMVQMLNDGIYGQKYRNYSLEFTTFHFLEEVGEVNEQIRKLRGLHKRRQTESSEEVIQDIRDEKDHLRRELADVYSWIAAIVIQLNKIKQKTRGLENYGDGPETNTEDRDILLTEVINQRYLNQETGKFECPTCKETKCNIKKHEEDFIYV
jgi:NTP pyrophosphatase (non-canonical NTP hydrolase)